MFMCVCEGFIHLDTVTVELEDCLGEGFLEFLRKRGAKLTSLTLSSSSDPEATIGR